MNFIVKMRAGKIFPKCDIVINVSLTPPCQQLSHSANVPNALPSHHYGIFCDFADNVPICILNLGPVCKRRFNNYPLTITATTGSCATATGHNNAAKRRKNWSTS